MRISQSVGIVVALVVAAAVASAGTMAARNVWLPWFAAPAASTPVGEPAGHQHGADAMANSVHLSPQARANLNLKLGPVRFSDYTRKLVIPGAIVEEPGHSERRITTALAGVIARIHAFPGQAVRPGDPLLEIQPTGELLTSAQAELLKTLQDLELVDIELKRLGPLVESGSIPARSKLEKEYERTRLESQKIVQIQELLVRGLTPIQITELAAHKTLLREFTIHVPGGPPKSPPKDDGHNHPSIVPTAMAITSETQPAVDLVYTIEQIDVFPGKHVQPGDELCDLALHTELYVEGHAFERDSRLLAAAVQEQRPVSVMFEAELAEPEIREGLQIRYVENSLDPATRTVRFYVPLKNEVVRDSLADNGVVYRSWRFKPGQKVRLLLPVQQLKQQFVVPAGAVVTEGPDAYVFRARGDDLERVPVVIEQRDPRQVVIRSQGGLFFDDEIALNQAYQINLALKRQQGSGVEQPHGHEH